MQRAEVVEAVGALALGTLALAVGALAVAGAVAVADVWEFTWAFQLALVWVMDIIRTHIMEHHTMERPIIIRLHPLITRQFSLSR
ncbi:MAG: hypothetical protein ABL869_04060 [Candidatus Nitrotoga sp.]